MGLLPFGHKIWILFDIDNGHEPVKHYCWWFNTRKDARNHKKWQKKQKYSAELIGPLKAFIQ